MGQARRRCWRYDYVIELDIKGLFDHIDHELLMKAVRKHIPEPWMVLYLKRWLKAPFITETKEVIARKSGTPQGGVVSPILANLFMHYAFDRWITRIIRCSLWRDMQMMPSYTVNRTNGARNSISIEVRLTRDKLELHPQKTKIIYCKDKDRKGDYPHTEFDFLGYTFKKYS
jgi:retron-type reverse transcriptase